MPTALIDQNELEHDAKQLSRVLILAHQCRPDWSMESRLSWFRALYAAEACDTVVICSNTIDITQHVPPHVARRLTMQCLPHNAIERLLLRLPGCFYLAYRLWQRRVFRLAQRLHRQRPFSLVHQVSYCGYREPGECWRLDSPFVWGPIGGTQNFPRRFLRELDPMGAFQESVRTVVNYLQLHHSPRVRRAIAAAKEIYTANREIQQTLLRQLGVSTRCQLETGIEAIAQEPRPLRDVRQPLRILWVGRMESWKALPLLLKALALLPEEFSYELRVVGSGSREKRWKQQARRWGVQQHICWQPFSSYVDRLVHYEWADVFVFTSLRDTSGTGLLESLAAGVPVVGLHHQGARDILAHDCAWRVEVERPRQVIAELADALRTLAADAPRLQQMSRAALQRARKFHWDRLGRELAAGYQNVVAPQPLDVQAEESLETVPLMEQTPTVAG